MRTKDKDSNSVTRLARKNAIVLAGAWFLISLTFYIAGKQAMILVAMLNAPFYFALAQLPPEYLNYLPFNIMLTAMILMAITVYIFAYFLTRIRSRPNSSES